MKRTLQLRNIKLFIAAAVLVLAVNSCEVDNLLNGTLEDLEGTWNCAENSDLIGPTSYVVYISVNPENSSEIIIDDFYDVNIGVVASVSGSSIMISNYSEAGYTVNGNGVISGNRRTITLSYSVSDSSGDPDQCTATYTKQ